MATKKIEFAAKNRKIEILQYPVSGKADAVLIWLHGLGDQPQGWAQFAEDFLRDDTMKGQKVLFPGAPLRKVAIAQNNVTTAWSDIYGLDENAEEDEVGFKESGAEICAIINDLQKNEKIPAARIILGGFSQGGALTAYIGTRCQNLTGVLGGYIVHSGWLPLREHKLDVGAGTNPRWLMLHGEDDEVVLERFGSLSAAKIKGLVGNENCKYVTIPNMAHQSSEVAFQEIRRFMSQAFQSSGSAVASASAVEGDTLPV